ncbi:HAD-IA family hydrolase [Nocardioides rotundus]|uniref:HAD family hydrolase n=1 Tax=Nocardioides rotundus TaxID=1774216 RepID=UPI001CBF8704|nr:HAD-IA family hydrolase [Nocardioides rotundus]UAL30928.1 HAD-IA family hydrolase [Nocardioides rotundus]
MTYPTVVFDLGNVLIRWDPRPALAAGVGDAEAARLLAAEDFDFAAWNAAQDAGRTFADGVAEVARSHPHWAEHVAAYGPNFAASITGEVEDTVRVLRDLHGAGVPLVALTNWAAETFPHARERFDFLELFDDIVVSGEERVAKPDPAIFEILARRGGRPLTECVFVDDSPANVEAAAAAGMDAIRFTDTGHLRGDLRARGLPV